MPMSWQTTSCIRPRNPAGGRRALPESYCAGGEEWFRCRRLELQAVFQGYFPLEWHRELPVVSCSLARIWHGNRQISAYCIIYVTDISNIIDIIAIIRIVVCLLSRHECALEGLGYSVSRSRCWEQEQNQNIPESIWRHNKGAIIDNRRPNHDKAEVMTAMKRFRWKWIAVNPLYTVVFGMTKHQTVEQSKMTLVFGRILRFQCPKESSYLKKKFLKILVLSFFY